MHPESAQVRVPAVLISAWLDPQGKPGCVLVNMSEQSQTVTLDCNSLGSAWPVDELVLESLESQVRLPNPGRAGSLVIDAPPLQVCVIRPYTA